MPHPSRHSRSALAQARRLSSANSNISSTTRETAFRFLVRNGVFGFTALAVLSLMVTLRFSASIADGTKAAKHKEAVVPKLPFQKKDINALPKLPSPGQNTENPWKLPAGFQSLVTRAQEHDGKCQKLEEKSTFSGYDTSSEIKYGDEMIATLPSMGIVDAIQEWNMKPGPTTNHATTRDPSAWQCQLPPETECQETKFTVVFMAYNPDRLGKTMKEIRKFLEDPEWTSMVEEVVITWNGERDVGESKDGQYVLKYAESHPLRIVYPLKMGFPNDLMNRYHPQVVQVKTKALLYYDDDGPFYSVDAIRGGFELWKRHSSVQIGAMARQLDYSPRQQAERNQLDPNPNDQLFVSHCTNVDDKIDYNFKYFANYDANMVLPSGSFLHSQYLCFLWHPVLERIREFVRAHPVHPDDITVSTIVSQLAGRAPRVYSRRLNPVTRRRLGSADDSEEDEQHDNSNNVIPDWINPQQQQQQQQQQQLLSDEADRLRHRRLMHGIDWDAGAGMNDAKRRWADLRTIAINALVRYFGSINSGSIGWCPTGSEFYNPKKDGRCDPIMAKQGQLAWMNPNNTPKSTCP